MLVIKNNGQNNFGPKILALEKILAIKKFGPKINFLLNVVYNIVISGKKKDFVQKQIC